MGEAFTFNLQTHTFYGFGTSRKLDEILKGNGLSRVLVLADEGCATKSEYFDEVTRIIERHAREVFLILLRGTEEPDYDYLDDVATRVRGLGKLDVVVGIGGGSCLDVTKAVAVLLTNPGKGIKYRGFDKVKVPGVPTIAIPTTAGTGSEVTINAVFTDKKEMKKLGINGRYMSATYSILDAAWTLSCPDSVAVSSGMDALTHAMESFICIQHNRLTRIYSREAFRLLYKNLSSIIDDPKNKDRRQLILLGSHLAATALFNSGSGIAGALSYPIGVHFKVPHGVAGGIFLSSVTEYNVNNGYTDYAELLDLIEFHPGYSLEEKNGRFTDLMRDLSRNLNVPKYLDAWGITRENVEEVAKLMRPLQAAFDQNPVPFSATEDALAMLRSHVKG